MREDALVLGHAAHVGEDWYVVPVPVVAEPADLQEGTVSQGHAVVPVSATDTRARHGKTCMTDPSDTWDVSCARVHGRTDV